MRKTKEIKKNRGITLIALIITIIVMLILVSVTINMAINDGLFEYAKKATAEMQNVINEEQLLAEGKIKLGGTWYNSIDEYLETTKEIHNWKKSGDTFTCSHCKASYKIGDPVRIDYETEAYNATATLTAEKSGLKEYYDDHGSYPFEDGEVDENGNQTIEMLDSSWIVLGIDDTNNDGSYETLLVTTEFPVDAKFHPAGDIPFFFYGAAAYNNAADELNRICKELYSNSEYGEARAMTVEDINNALKYKPTGGIYEDAEGTHYTDGFDITLAELPSDVWNSLKQTGTVTPNPNDEDSEANLGAYKLDGYYYGVVYYEEEDTVYVINDVDDTKIPITYEQFQTIFCEWLYSDIDNSPSYFLATRAVAVSPFADEVVFGIGVCERGSVWSCEYNNPPICNNYGDEFMEFRSYASGYRNKI